MTKSVNDTNTTIPGIMFDLEMRSLRRGSRGGMLLPGEASVTVNGHTLTAKSRWHGRGTSGKGQQVTWYVDGARVARANVEAALAPSCSADSAPENVAPENVAPENVAPENVEPVPVITEPGTYATRDGRRVTIFAISAGSETFPCKGSLWVMYRGKMRPRIHDIWTVAGRVDVVHESPRDIVCLWAERPHRQRFTIFGRLEMPGHQGMRDYYGRSIYARYARPGNPLPIAGAQHAYWSVVSPLDVAHGLIIPRAFKKQLKPSV